MKKAAFTIIGWLVSISLIAAIAARIDFGVLWQGFAKASWPYLLAAAAINIVVIALKALRWQWLMRPERRTHYAGIFRATMIGLAGNNVLPARGGDWLRIYLLGKWEGVSRAMLASVTGLDKIFDGMSILMLFGVFSFHSTFPEWVLKGTLIISIAIAMSLVIAVLLLLHHRRTPEYEIEELGRLSSLAKRLGSGMGALASKKLLATNITLSIVICLLQVETIRCCQQAFGMRLDVWVPVLIFVAINLSIVIPSAPSGVGPFEAAAVLAYAWLGVSAERGFNIAFMYHAVQFFPVTAIGFLLYLRATRPGVKHLQPFAPRAEETI